MAGKKEVEKEKKRKACCDNERIVNVVCYKNKKEFLPHVKVYP